MEISEQLAYSLCSKNTKKAIKSLNLKAKTINIHVADFIRVYIYVQNLILFWNSMEHTNVFPNNQIMIHENIKLALKENEGTRTDWKDWIWDFGKCNFETLDFKEWLHHFCEVLHHPRIDNLYFHRENLDENYIEPIQQVIKGLQIEYLGVFIELTNELGKKILESFPNYEKLALGQIPFDYHKLNKCLVQNLKSICIPRAEKFKIDQVLVSNSVTIALNSLLLKEKDLNRLLKLWIRGSNPRLKYLYTREHPIPGNHLLDKNLILKGIKHNQIPLDSEEVYGNSIDHYYMTRKLAGGSRIWRFNGDTAVIVVARKTFEFIVE